MHLMNGYIRAGRLCEFVDSFVQSYNKDEEDKAVWDIWLHRVFDRSFADFRRELTGENEKAAPTPEETRSIVKDSQSILAGFTPFERVGEQDGTVQAAGHDSG